MDQAEHGPQGPNFFPSTLRWPTPQARAHQRARALIELTDDLEDHYSQMASYLRLNGMIPPSAKK